PLTRTSRPGGYLEIGVSDFRRARRLRQRAGLRYGDVVASEGVQNCPASRAPNSTLVRWDCQRVQFQLPGVPQGITHDALGFLRASLINLEASSCARLLFRTGAAGRTCLYSSMILSTGANAQKGRVSSRNR